MSELELAQAALRYIYEHGLQHSTKRPTWLNQVIDMAHKPVRDGIVQRGAYPLHDMQVRPTKPQEA